MPTRGLSTSATTARLEVSGPPSGGGKMATIRLTAARALVRFLAAQRAVLDGVEVPLFAGCCAIFGHGNVAGTGAAFYQVRDSLPTFRAHNEQGMALAAAAFAEAK